ncbi:MAG: C39 family peptidase [Raoultibacter sp.]
MSRFDDPEAIKQQAQKRLDARRGQNLPAEKQAARQRLEARGEKATKRTQGAQTTKATKGVAGVAAQGVAAAGAALRGALAQAPSKRVLVISISALVLCVLIFGVLMGGFSACSKNLAPAPSEPPAAEEAPSAQEAPTEPIVIPSYFDPTVGAALLAAAPGNSDIDWIARHVQDYAFDGPEVQYKMLKLATLEPAAIPFVRNFPASYPAAGAQPSSDTIVKGTIPLLQQWDPRWGYTTYSSAPFGLSGCCPTAFSMVYQGLTGKNDMNPAAMGSLAAQDGFMDEYKGTDGAFLTEDAEKLGLSGNKIPVDAESLRVCLRAGEVVICNVGPGDFTTDGHFFVITGLNDDGTLRINDPYSAVRSATSWNIDQVLKQTMALYSFRAL